jgi:glycine betaine/choline ABC-type transport system substrate-binding protein
MRNLRLLGCLAAAAFLTGCIRPQPPIKIGSKGTTDQEIVAEIVRQHLAAKTGAKRVLRQTIVGPTAAYEALLGGQIDVYAESMGAAASILRLPLTPDQASVEERVRQECSGRLLVWLAPLGFHQSYALAVRAAEAREQGIATISDAERTAGWSLGATTEFLDRVDGMPALLRNYKLPVKLAPTGVDLPRIYAALRAKDVDMVATTSSDGVLAAPDLLVLKDDRGAFLAWTCALLTRTDSLAQHRGLRAALDGLAGRFTDARLREMTRKVDLEKHPVEQVAREFLDH